MFFFCFSDQEGSSDVNVLQIYEQVNLKKIILKKMYCIFFVYLCENNFITSFLTLSAKSVLAVIVHVRVFDLRVHYQLKKLRLTLRRTSIRTMCLIVDKLD